MFPSELAEVLINSRNVETETIDDLGYIPARRTGGDEEMAGNILYMASRAGAYCNGYVHVADGGRFSIMGATY